MSSDFQTRFAMKIVKILSVVDTRQYEEVGDKWVPIPGSGDEHECSRCGKPHEVHATVLTEDGKTKVVGTGCAAKDNMEMASRFNSLDRASKRLAMLKAEQKAYLTKVEKWDRNWKETCAVQNPEILESFGIYQSGDKKGQKYPTLKMGKAEVPCWLTGITDERRSAVLNVWRQMEMVSMGLPAHRPHSIRFYSKEILKLEKRIKNLMELNSVAISDANRL